MIPRFLAQAVGEIQLLCETGLGDGNGGGQGLSVDLCLR